MKLNSAVWGEPTDRTLNGFTFKGPGYSGGELSQLLADGHIALNTKFDQSIIFTTTTNSAWTNYMAIDNSDGSNPQYSHLRITEGVAGIILATISPLNPIVPLTPSGYGNTPTVMYNATGYGVKQYGHNPYGSGSYITKCFPVAGYKWENLRYYIIVVAMNTILAEQQSTIYNMYSNNALAAVYLDDYLNNTNNVATNYPVIIGAYLGARVYNTNNNPYIYPIIYGTLNTTAISFDTVIENDLFLINTSSYMPLGMQYDWFRSANNQYLMAGMNSTLFDIYRLPYGPNKTRSMYYSRLRGSPRDLIRVYASLGLPITTNPEHAAKDAVTGGTIYAMNIDDTGKTDGNLVNGNDISNIRQSDFTDDILTNNGFNGIDNVDPNNYTDKIDLNKPALSTTNIFNRTFALNANNVKSLADFLWNADETKFDEIIKGLGLMGENPIDGLIDLRMYPFDVALKNSSTAAESIVVGRTDTGVNGIKITDNANAIIDLGSCSFFQKFKNFLDYEPYTTAQLYIPYVGVVPVSTAEFMGHNISCKMIVDFVTGGCTAVVYKDDIPYIYRNGTMAVEVPMTATNSARMAQTALNNVIGAVMDTGKTIGALGNGDIGGAITGGISALSNVYSAASIPTQYQTAGASTANCATWQPQNCYFIIDRPITQIPDNYGHTVGYACEQTGTLNSFSGFTVIANPDINFKCTDTEKTMLINALQGGVYV